MTNPSAYVSVNSVNVPLTGTSGANVSSGASVTVKLVSTAGVQNWSLSCTSVDDLSSQTLVNNSMVINLTTFTATFNAPTTTVGAALQFTSIVNAGYANQNVFEFGVFVPLDGYRVFFGGESNESNATVGTCADLNTLVRAVALGGGGGTFTAGGDLTGSSASQTVAKIQGVAVTTTGIASGSVLTATGTTSASWSPPAVPTAISGVTVSGTPSAGQVLTATSTSAANWQTVAAGGSFTAGGDLTGTSTNQFVSKIQGVSITGTGAAANKVLMSVSGSAGAWQYVNQVNNVVINSTNPTAGQVLTAISPTSAQWSSPASGTFSPGGDLSGSSSSQTVIGIHGNPVSGVAATAGQILVEQTGATGSAWTTLSQDGYIGTGSSGGTSTPSYRGVNVPCYVIGYNVPYLSQSAVAYPGGGNNYCSPSTADINYLYGKYATSGATPTIMLSFTMEAMQAAGGSNLNTAAITTTVTKTSNTYCSNFFATVDALLAKGFTVILKAHQLNDSAQVAFTYNNITIGNSGFSNSQFGAFWAMLAGLYSSNANVWFGLMNEPNGVTDSQWTGGMQQAINSIRGVNTVGKILVSVPNYDGCVNFFNANYSGTATPAVLYAGLTGTNLVCEVHNYGDDNSGYQGISSELQNSSVFVTYLSPIITWASTNGFKVFVGEFAADTANGLASTAVGNMYSLMNSNASVCIGATWWTYTPTSYGPSLFDLQPTTPYTVDDADMALFTPMLTYSAGGSGGGSAIGALYVQGLQTVPISTTKPTTNQVLTYNGTSWAPATPTTGGITALTGDVSASGSGSVAATINSISVTNFKETFPAAQGTVSTQSKASSQYVGYATVTNATVTVITIPLATSHTSVSVVAQGIWRVTSATGIGSTGTQSILLGCTNIGGTLNSFAGANVAGPIGTSTYNSEISFTTTTSGTNFLIQLTSTSTDTFDCTVVANCVFS